MIKSVGGQKFATGKIYMTRGIAAITLDNQEAAKAVASAFARHIRGDWGDLGDEDKQSNDRALSEGNRLLSRYNNMPSLGSIYIITEWDRSVTTILLPDEY